MSMGGAGTWPCTACRSDVNIGDKFCITCGAAYDDLKCQNCNATITVGFDCSECNTPIDWDLFFGVKKEAEQSLAPGQPTVPKPVTNALWMMMPLHIKLLLVVWSLAMPFIILGTHFDIQDLFLWGIALLWLPIVLMYLAQRYLPPSEQ